MILLKLLNCIEESVDVQLLAYHEKVAMPGTTYDLKYFGAITGVDNTDLIH